MTKLITMPHYGIIWSKMVWMSAPKFVLVCAYSKTHKNVSIVKFSNDYPDFFHNKTKIIFDLMQFRSNA